MPKRLTCTLYTIALSVACALMTLEVQAGGKDGKHKTTQNAEASGEANADALVQIDNSQGRVDAADLGDHVPDAYAPSYPTSHNCALGVSGAVSVSGFGFSSGGTYKDEDCVTRLDSEHAARIGDKTTAHELMCAKYKYYAANRRARAAGSEGYTCMANAEFDKRLSPAGVEETASRSSADSSTYAGWPDVLDGG